MKVTSSVLRVFLFFSVFCLGACNQKKEPPKELTTQEKNERTLKRHCYEVGNRLAKQHNLLFNGGSGSNHTFGYNPKKISFHFQVFRSFTKNQARQLIFDCVQVIQKEFNENPEILPYIPEGGYDINHMYVHFMIQPNKEVAFHPEIGGAGLFMGKVTFVTNDPEKDYISRKTRVSETWNETLAYLDQYEKEHTPTDLINEELGNEDLEPPPPEGEGFLLHSSASAAAPQALRPTSRRP